MLRMQLLRDRSDTARELLTKINNTYENGNNLLHELVNKYHFELDVILGYREAQILQTKQNDDGITPAGLALEKLNFKDLNRFIGTADFSLQHVTNVVDNMSLDHVMRCYDFYLLYPESKAVVRDNINKLLYFIGRTRVEDEEFCYTLYEKYPKKLVNIVQAICNEDEVSINDKFYLCGRVIRNLKENGFYVDNRLIKLFRDQADALSADIQSLLSEVDIHNNRIMPPTKVEEAACYLVVDNIATRTSR